MQTTATLNNSQQDVAEDRVGEGGNFMQRVEYELTAV